MRKMENSKIKIGSFLMLSMGMYTVVISLLWIFLTEIMFVSDFMSYTSLSYQEYLATNPRFAEIYIITKKLIGFMLLAIGCVIVLITQKSYRNGEKWAWYALLIAGGITWGTFIIYKIVIGYIGVSMMTFVVGAALVVVGLALPAKEILGKK